MPILDDRSRFSSHRVWWRDDDFTDYFSTFGALERVADHLGIRPLVAAIPGNMSREFRLRDASYRFAVHGWKHVDHGCTDNRKSEYGRGRAASGVLEELLAARQLASEYFGDCLENWFVPPFNRITEPHFDALRAARFEALSSSGDARHWVAQFPELKLPLVSVDVWCHAENRVKDGPAVEAELTQRLLDGSALGPQGLMTHHKKFRAADWERFVAIVLHLRAAGWPVDDCDAEFCEGFPTASRLAASPN